MKEMKDNNANYWFNFTICSKLCWGFNTQQRRVFYGSWWSSNIAKFWTRY
jgi:hypothetical protein